MGFRAPAWVLFRLHFGSRLRPRFINDSQCLIGKGLGIAMLMLWDRGSRTQTPSTGPVHGWVDPAADD